MLHACRDLLKSFEFTEETLDHLYRAFFKGDAIRFQKNVPVKPTCVAL